jgi:two-component system sensor histidine kinase UhpB
LDQLGLAPAIEVMLARLSQSSGVRFRIEIDELNGALPKQAEISFYRIVQEGVNNIVRHARATEASVTVERHGQAVRLSIRDNGTGFAPHTTAPVENGRRGFGLMGMAERARTLGGQLTLNSAPGQGTTISLTLNAKDQI